MNNQNKIIPLFFAVDDNYVPHLCVALRSIIDNCSKNYFYHINVLIEELTTDSKNAIRQFESEKISVKFYSVTQKLRGICARLHLRDYYTKATYYRFFIPEMFPEYSKGIYLDCDIVVNADISKLYSKPLGGCLAGAMPEEVITDIDTFGTYSEKVLGVPRYRYFNAGIMVMNLTEMRKFHIEERFAELIGKRTFSVAQDQDYLNVLCYGRVAYISKWWNKTPMPNSNEERKPYIVHYKINFKPWRYDDIPYAEYFWEYAEKTQFYGYFLNSKKNYSNGEKERDSLQYENLLKLAKEESEACQFDASALFMEVI